MREFWGLERDSQTLREQLSGMKRKSLFMCVCDTTTSIDGELLRADKDQTMTDSFGVPTSLS